MLKDSATKQQSSMWDSSIKRWNHYREHAVDIPMVNCASINHGTQAATSHMSFRHGLLLPLILPQFLLLRFRLSLLLLPLLVLFPARLNAQEAGSNDPLQIFQDARPIRLHLDIDPGDLRTHLDRHPLPPEERIQIPASLMVETTDRTATMSAMVRVGPPQSVHYPDPLKRSYQFHFEEENPLGLRGLHVNGDSQDPTLIRSVLAHRIARRIGLPVPEAVHAELYINGEYRGLYTIEEPVDDVFLRKQFGMGDGSLYRAGRSADLGYLGSTPSLYDRLDADGQPMYEAVQSPEADPHHDLAEFITFLATAPSKDFAPALRTRFNVDAFLRWMAFETLLGHWDNYWIGATNYHLYANPATGRYEYLPDRLDHVFGLWFGPQSGSEEMQTGQDALTPVDWGTRNVYTWGFASFRRVLIERILGQQEFLSQYTYYLQYIIDTVFMLQYLKFDIEDLQDDILASVERDTFRTLDYGFTLDDFYVSFSDSLGGHVTYGLYSFIRARTETAVNQFIWTEMQPVIRDVRVDLIPVPAGADPFVRFSAYAQSNRAFRLDLYDEEGTPIVELLDDGNGLDESKADNIHTALVNSSLYPALRRVYLKAEDLNSFTQRYPFQEGKYLTVPGTSEESDDIVINEIGFHPDGRGWVEVYNPGASRAPMDGVFLSPDEGSPFRLRVADNDPLPSGALRVLEAEVGTTPGYIHLYRKQGIKAVLVDSVAYPSLDPGQSYGRDPAFNRPFTVYEDPSPGRSNGTSTSVSEHGAPAHDNDPEHSVTLLPNRPNPFNPTTFLRFHLGMTAHVSITVTDALGRSLRRLDLGVLQKGDHETILDLSHLPSGLYIYSVTTPTHVAQGRLTLLR